MVAENKAVRAKRSDRMSLHQFRGLPLCRRSIVDPFKLAIGFKRKSVGGRIGTVDGKEIKAFVAKTQDKDEYHGDC
jgi:hypothetical protein